MELLPRGNDMGRFVRWLRVRRYKRSGLPLGGKNDFFDANPGRPIRESRPGRTSARKLARAVYGDTKRRH